MITITTPDSVNYYKTAKLKEIIVTKQYTDDSCSEPFRSNDRDFLNIYQWLKEAPYIPFAGCVFEHILANSKLSPLEKLYYLLADGLSLINHKSGKQRAIALSSQVWAGYLNCSKAQIFNLQKSLEQKGYFNITKSYTKVRQNNRNLIIPTIPDDVFASLDTQPLRKSGRETLQLPQGEGTQNKREYLDKTKLFIPLNYQLLKNICQVKELNPLCKVLWLNFFALSYKNHISNNNSDFCFISSYQKLSLSSSCNKNALSKSITSLEALHFINRQRSFVKKEGAKALENRKDGSLWTIKLSLPEKIVLQLSTIKTRSSVKIAAKDDKLERILDEGESILRARAKKIQKEKKEEIKTVLPKIKRAKPKVSYIKSTTKKLHVSSPVDPENSNSSQRINRVLKKKRRILKVT